MGGGREGWRRLVIRSSSFVTDSLGPQCAPGIGEANPWGGLRPANHMDCAWAATTP